MATNSAQKKQAQSKKTAKKTAKIRATAKPPAKKPPAKKPAVKKPASKKAANAKSQPTAKKAAVKKPAPARTKKTKTTTTAQKTAAKKTTGTGKRKASPKKTAAKKTVKTTASAKTAVKKKTVKSTTATKSTKSKLATDKSATAKKAKPKVKLNVGQKPRSEKSPIDIRATIITTPQKPIEAVTSSTVRASPEAKEAKQTFKVNEKIVYPAHGVGKILSVEKQHIAGITNELFVIVFEQEKMKLRVPTSKAVAVGMRALSENSLIDRAVETLMGRARIKRTMWSRRAQEYEAKINSGDIMSVAEVVRDLYRAADQPEQSYSERQLFEQALDRLAREVAAVRKTDMEGALAELDASLQLKKTAA